MTSNTYTTILQVAKRLFAHQGYTATSIRQIAAESGIGKATIYHHFPNKQAIVLALLEQNTVQRQQVLETFEAESDPRRRIEIATQANLRFLYESADILQIVRREVPGGRDKLQNEYAAFFRQYTTLIIEALQQGIQEGIFRRVDPPEVARVLITMIQGAFAMTHITGDRIQPPEKTAAALLDIFFHGIQKT
jgi:AcrR family transcriptional regulator